uniref:Uncharacterized protein n=1 Tax=Anguilla anguilla TaxID=7936 RepID=A0A0E9SAR7_ANGAN
MWLQFIPSKIIILVFQCFPFSFLLWHHDSLCE